MADSHNAVVENKEKKNNIIAQLQNVETKLASATSTIKKQKRELTLKKEECSSLLSTTKETYLTSTELASDVKFLKQQNETLKANLKVNTEHMQKIGDGIAKVLGALDKKTLDKLLAGFSIKDKKSAQTLINAVSRSNSRNLVESLALYSKLTTVFSPIRVHLNHSHLEISLLSSQKEKESISLPRNLRESYSNEKDRNAAAILFKTSLKKQLTEFADEKERQIILFSFSETKKYAKEFVILSINKMKELYKDSIIFVNCGYYRTKG